MQQGLWVITQALEFVSQVVVCVFHGCCVLSGRLGMQPELGLDRRELLMRLAQMIVVQHQKRFIIIARYAGAGSAPNHGAEFTGGSNSHLMTLCYAAVCCCKVLAPLGAVTIAQKV